MAQLESSLFENLIGHATPKKLWLRGFEQKHLPHAFLFVGPPGVGKLSAAVAFAQKLICPEQGCGRCGACKRVAQRASESLMIVEAEERQIKMEQAKEIIKFLSLKSPQAAQVVIINEADRLNSQAANALLKIIEEPPEGSYFFLTAGSEGSVLSTIRSRCQVMRFSRLSDVELAALTQTEPADWRIGASQGSLAVFEQLSDPDLTHLRSLAFQYLERLLLADTEPDSEAVEVFKKRQEAGILIHFWQQLLRDVRIAQAQPEKSGGGWIHRDFKELIEKLAQHPPRWFDQIYGLTLQLERDWEANVDRQILLAAFNIEVRRLKVKEAARA